MVLALALGAGRVRPASPTARLPLQQPATALADHTSSGGLFPHFGTATAAQAASRFLPHKLQPLLLASENCSLVWYAAGHMQRR